MVEWKNIEEKWQRRWAEAKAFETDPAIDKPKFYLTVAYPYPNSPQHIGHGRTYTLTEVHARFQRMHGTRPKTATGITVLCFFVACIFTNGQRLAVKKTNLCFFVTLRKTFVDNLHHHLKTLSFYPSAKL